VCGGCRRGVSRHREPVDHAPLGRRPLGQRRSRTR
jgi:hypothetical protein